MVAAAVVATSRTARLLGGRPPDNPNNEYDAETVVEVMKSVVRCSINQRNALAKACKACYHEGNIELSVHFGASRNLQLRKDVDGGISVVKVPHRGQ